MDTPYQAPSQLGAGVRRAAGAGVGLGSACPGPRPPLAGRSVSGRVGVGFMLSSLAGAGLGCNAIPGRLQPPSRDVPFLLVPNSQV